MKQKKNTGALIVSLLLAAVLIGTYVGVAVKLGMMIHLAANGGVSMDAVQPMPNEVEDLPGANIPSDSVQTEAPAQAEGSRYPTRVEFEKITDDGNNMYAEITGYFEDGSLWQYYTPAYPVTELDPVEEIIGYEDTFIFCAGGKVIALDTMTGTEKWVNEDFNGYSPVWLSDAQRTICLSGFYGPDLHIVDADGNTIAHVEQMDEDYYWPIGVQKPDENTVTVIFSMGPDGEAHYPVDYNLVTGQVTVPFVPEAQGAELMWMRGYRTLMDKEALSFADGYALLYLDDDDVPELFLRGNDKALLLSYDMENDEIYQTEVSPYDFCYYPHSGVYSINKYEENRSEEAFYTFEKGRATYVGTGTMRHYDEKEPECWWDGDSLSVNDFYRKIDAVRPRDVRAAYARAFPKQMLLAQLDCWYNPEQNMYWGWKEDYLDTVRYNMESGDAYALVDVDGNGVPELFSRFTEANGEVYTQMQMFDAQTHQSMYIGFSGDKTAYIPGESILTDTYTYNEYCSDTIYQISNMSIRQIAFGDRNLHADGAQTCYFNGAKVSQKAYEQEMAPLYDERAVYIEDCFVSAEQVIAQLK